MDRRALLEPFKVCAEEIGRTDGEMNLNYRYRLYPSKEQEQRLLKTLDLCRHAYNFFLGQMRFIQKEEGRIPSRYELQALLPLLKEEHPEFKSVNSKVLQMVLHQLYSNLKVLSKLKKNGKKVGMLRFKGQGWYKTMTFNQSGFKLNSKLWLSKIGDISIKLHRKIKGEIKQVKIKREATGKWFACLCVDIDNNIESKAGRAIGLDVGIKHFLTDSEGRQVENPRDPKVLLTICQKHLLLS